MRTKLIIMKSIRTFMLIQGKEGKTLNQCLRSNLWWNSLTGTERQLIGKNIANYGYLYANFIGGVCKKYSYTDDNGNGIYT